MLLIWDAIEADFLRDYSITLMEQIDHMTWRHFLVLLNNLNPHGAVAARVRAETDKMTETTESEDEKAANDFFSSIVSM